MAEYAGPAWVARFPGSDRIADCVDPFKTNLAKFVLALKNGGSDVRIVATFRPPERAYLMHYACWIKGFRDKQGIFQQAEPATIPPMTGVDIDWTCGGNFARAKAFASQMVSGYGIVYPAALNSRHTQGRAVDMHITVPAGATISDAAGHAFIIAGGADGTDSRIVAIGKTFGVIKLASDPPHWSDDGH